MGQSQPAGARITIEQLAEDTLAVMDAAGIDAAHLAGHSLGGAIAMQIALTAPRRAASLSLLCTSGCGSDATRLRFPMVWLGLRSRLGTRRMRAQAFLEIVMPPEYLATQDRDALAELLRPLLGHDLADTPPVAMRQLKALTRFDATSRLSALSGIPTLVLSAERDIIFPPQCGRDLAAAIPGARYVEIGHAAHGVTIQCAEAVNRVLLEHFSSAGLYRRINAAIS
jgi:pimeloyl-ACP methyl ester carboxylesterase